MSLPPALVSHLRALDGFAEVCLAYPWGTITRSPSFPALRDANRAWVFDVASPTLAELEDATAAAQSRFAVDFTQVEVVGLDHHAHLAAEVARWLGPPPDVFSVMATTSAPATPTAAGVLVEEVDFPSVDEWAAMIAAAHPGPEGIPPDVARQMAGRDVGVLAPAGLRLFALRDHGTTVAHATLFSHAGVGLIDNVATLPAHRRRGLATAVVSSVLHAGARDGNHLAFLFTARQSPAERIYARLGLRTLARAAQFRAEP